MPLSQTNHSCSRPHIHTNCNPPGFLNKHVRDLNLDHPKVYLGVLLQIPIKKIKLGSEVFSSVVRCFFYDKNRGRENTSGWAWLSVSPLRPRQFCCMMPSQQQITGIGQAGGSLAFSCWEPKFQHTIPSLFLMNCLCSSCESQEIQMGFHIHKANNRGD